MTQRMILLAGLFMLSGCVIGPTVTDIPLAHSAEGVHLWVTVDEREINGELLALSDSSLLLLGSHPDDDLLLISFAAIEGGRSVRSGRWRRSVAFGPLFTLGRSDREWLRLVSRLPQGANQEMVGLLLRAYGQDSLRVVSR